MVDSSYTVMVADQFSAAGIQEMKDAGINVVYDGSLAGDKLTEAIKANCPKVLVVRSTKVTAADVDACEDMKVVIRAGAGTDTIDKAHCSSKKVQVANCPGKNANAVAELAIGMMLSIDRRMAEGNQMLHEGKWNKGMFATCKGIFGRTIGIIGFGAIGQLVCKAAKAFGMNVLVHTRTQHDGMEEEHGMKYASLDDLLAGSDIVSLHCPGGD